MSTNETEPAIEPNSASQFEAEPRTLSERVAAAQHRIAESTAPARQKAGEQAQAAASSFSAFAKEHPVLTVVGGLAAGAAIALALPGKPGRKVRGSVLAASGIVAELAAKYGSRMMTMAEEAAHLSQDKLEELGESLADTGEIIANRTSEAASQAGTVLTRASNTATRRGQSIASRLKR